MHYIDKQDETLGIKTVPTDFSNLIMENLGFSTGTEEEGMPALYETGGNVFGLDPEVTEVEGHLFIKLHELSDELFEGLAEEDEVTTSVILDDETFFLSEDVYEIEDSFYVGLLSDDDTSEEEVVEESVMEIDGTDYRVVDEDDAEFVAYLQEEDEEGSYSVVNESDATDKVFLAAIEAE